MIKVSAEVNEIIEFSKVISQNLGHSFIGTEHLLLALMGRKKSEEFIRLNVPDAKNISYSQLVKEVLERNGQGERCMTDSRRISSNYKKVLSKCYIRAFSRKAELVDVEDVVKGLFNEKDCTAVEIFESCKQKNFSIDNNVIKTFSLNREKIMKMRKDTPVLNNFSRDVTLEALDDKLDPVIERDAEIDRVIRVLLRKNKNNPCLLGNAGVGKTAIADGIAQRIVEGRVPTELSEKRIVSLDIALLLSGAKYRGDFEERLKNIFEEVKKAKNVILVIDEIHNIVNTGNGEGTLDAANILKPELARGDISIIGATTCEEYMKTIEKDAALERRFQKVLIEEPSHDTAEKILKGIRHRYEAFHNINIEDSALTKALQLSIKELPNRYLPDKAIDIIDEACALVKLEGKSVLNSDEVEYSFYKNFKKHVITTEELTAALKKELYGQDDAIEKTVCAVVNRDGFFEDSSPLSMLFVGPTGCGKTTLAKLLSKNLFGEHSLLKLDMGEYSEKHSVAKLIGAPPGYVGYQDNGVLVNAVTENSHRVILFDEIEKAHTDVLKVLLNILDDGVMRNTGGKSVNFNNCIFILTSNIGFENKVKEVGFSISKRRFDPSHVINAIGKAVYGRIDSTIVFEKANEKCADKLCELLVEKCRYICFEQKVSLEVDGEVINTVLKKSDIETFGYRNLKKVFSATVEKELKKAWISRTQNLSKIRLYVDNDGEIAHFSYFTKIGLENKELSMYNRLKSSY